jgi:hypothetical protein
MSQIKFSADPLRSRISLRMVAAVATAALAVAPASIALAHTAGAGTAGATSTTAAPGTTSASGMATSTAPMAGTGAMNGPTASTGTAGTGMTGNGVGATTTTPGTNMNGTTSGAYGSTSTSTGTFSNGYSNNGMVTNGTGQAGSMPATVGPDNIPVLTLTPQTDGSIDYSVLSDPTIKPWDLKRAKAYGLTLDQISEAYYLAKITYVPFGQILNDVEDGCTFASIAEMYGAPLSVAYSPERYRDHISDYMAAWDATGTHGWWKYHTGDMSMPMSHGMGKSTNQSSTGGNAALSQ